MAREDTLEAALLEELRFAKRQQWTVTAGVATFIVGAYNVVKPLGPCEKVVATVLVTSVVVGGIYWLYGLQDHLRNTRLWIDPRDKRAWRRGSEIVDGMAGLLVISATAVIYLFWRDLILGMEWPLLLLTASRIAP